MHRSNAFDTSRPLGSRPRLADYLRSQQDLLRGVSERRHPAATAAVESLATAVSAFTLTSCAGEAAVSVETSVGAFTLV